MKLILIVFICSLEFCFGSELSDELSEQIRNVANLCKFEAGASEADLQNLLAHELSETYEGNCMRVCVMETFGTLTCDKKFDKQRILDLVQMISDNDEREMEIAKKMIDICTMVRSEKDTCYLVGKLDYCYLTLSKLLEVKFIYAFSNKCSS